jgi:hypothetical protein
MVCAVPARLVPGSIWRQTLTFAPRAAGSVLLRRSRSRSVSRVGQFYYIHVPSLMVCVVLARQVHGSTRSPTQTFPALAAGSACCGDPDPDPDLFPYSRVGRFCFIRVPSLMAVLLVLLGSTSHPTLVLFCARILSHLKPLFTTGLGYIET